MYVLISRVTDPKNFHLIGVPPRDVLEDVAAALIADGVDVDQFFENACKVTGEWEYDRSKARLVDRLQQKFSSERSVPLRFRTLAEMLNPQPEAQVVIVCVVEAGGELQPRFVLQDKSSLIHNQEYTFTVSLEQRAAFPSLIQHHRSSTRSGWIG